MLKRLYFLVVTALLFYIKLSSAHPDVSSAYDDAVSSSDSTTSLAQSTSCSQSSGEKHTAVCGLNEVFSDCLQGHCGPKNCSQLDTSLPCPFYDPKLCIEGCVCKDNYITDDNGICIPKNKCPPKCGINEIYMKCIESDCKAWICAQLGFPLDCTTSQPKMCTEGCACKDGYLRDDIGTCVSNKLCPSCGGDPNAEYGCGLNCNRHCYNIGKEPESCIASCYNNACDCKDGFYFDDNIGKCVLPEQCTPVCGQNEVYANYTESDCKAFNCSQLGFPLECSSPETSNCIEGCICKDGYLRADNGTCIPNTACPSCGGDPNAEPGCGLNCNKHCYNIGKGPESCIAVCYENACDCKDGFYFDDNIGKCVLPKQCTPVCGQNEVYANYTEGECKAFNCSQLGYPLECSSSETSICIEGCICKDGYLRADNGTCIPSTACTSCGGDPNAEPGCGLNCNKHCYSIDKGPESCIAVCYENACDCKDGFYFDDNIRKCVLPNQCTPVCGKNEKYTNCTVSECKPFNCSQLGFPLQCLNSQAKNCTEGCVCKDGYLRDDNGICIPTTACPLSLTITSASSTSTASAVRNNIEGQLAKFHKGNLALSGELLYQLVQSKPGASFVASALSALIPFAELALYANGLTLEQLLKLINLENKDQIRQSFPILLKKFQGQETVIFEVANKFYGNNYYPLSDTFKQEALSVFNNEGENIDFINTTRAADVINKWVMLRTGSRLLLKDFSPINWVYV